MSLRSAILVLAALTMLSGAAMLWASHGHRGIALLLPGALTILVVVFERWRYRQRLTDSTRWIPTAERFEDPISGEVLEVLYDPVSGERRYQPLKRRSP